MILGKFFDILEIMPKKEEKSYTNQTITTEKKFIIMGRLILNILLQNWIY